MTASWKRANRKVPDADQRETTLDNNGARLTIGLKSITYVAE
jgi:hypothetical protein